MRGVRGTAGMIVLGTLLAGCSAAAAAGPANTASSPVPQASTGSGAATTPTVIGGVNQPVQGPLTPLAARGTGPVRIRTFTGPASGFGSTCDPLNDSCSPAWCQPTGQLVAEVSTEAMAAIRRVPLIGVAPGSHLSVLGEGYAGVQPAGSNSTGTDTDTEAAVGEAEGDPVQVQLVRVAPDVATVRLHTPDGEDVVTPTKGLAAVAVHGSSPTGRLEVLDAQGRQLQSVQLPATPTSDSSQCAPQPPAPPKAGTPPRDKAAAERAVRAAFAAVFSHEPPASSYAQLRSVEGGSDLRGALDQLRRNFPQAVDTVSVTTSTIVFTSPTTAVARFRLTYSGGAPYGTRNGGAVLENGRWLVSRDTYCQVLSFGSADCPAR